MLKKLNRKQSWLNMFIDERYKRSAKFNEIFGRKYFEDINFFFKLYLQIIQHDKILIWYLMLKPI